VIHRVASRRIGPTPHVPLPPEPLELDACYRYCEATARARHHNFPVASLFAPSKFKKHIFALYAFARAADDFADQPEFNGRRSVELDRWEQRLEACYYGEAPDHPVFVALADTVNKFELPITPFRQLLAGFRLDLEQRRMGTSGDLRNYAELAAAPIGQLMLYMTGNRDINMMRFAEELSCGLAYASFWQDIAEDLDRDRIYVPADELRFFGVTEADLFARRETPEIAAMVRFGVARTRAILEKSRPLVDRVGSSFAIEVALVWHGGMRILEKIDDLGAAILHKRPQLNSVDKAQAVTRALAWRGESIGPRLRRRLLSAL